MDELDKWRAKALVAPFVMYLTGLVNLWVGVKNMDPPLWPLGLVNLAMFVWCSVKAVEHWRHYKMLRNLTLACRDSHERLIDYIAREEGQS